MSNNVNTGGGWTLESAIKQIECCEFACDAGPLTNNAAFRWLKALLVMGPKFHLDQRVEYSVSAEVNGVKVSQVLSFWVVGISMSSDTERLTFSYSLSSDPPRPYHYGSGVQFLGVAEKDLSAVIAPKAEEKAA